MSLIWFLVGAGVILGMLTAIGITRNRYMSQKTWVILWTIISFSFAAFILAGFISYDANLIDFALGGSLGFVVAISIHVLHHTLEEIKKGQESTEIQKKE